MAATSSRTIVPGLTCGNPSRRRKLQTVSATDDPPVDRLTPATGGSQGRLASTKAARIQIDPQAALAAHPEIEQRLEPVFIGGGGDDDQPAAMAPLLPLRVEQGGQRDRAIGLGQGEMLEELLLLLLAAGRLDHAQPAVIAHQADGAAAPQCGIRDG